jgi:hypothetical protein
MSQSLFDPGPPKLTDRQQHLYDAVRSSEDGLTADEAGAVLHEARALRPHSRDARCAYCTLDGRSVLAALRRKGLVTRKRSGQWHALAGQTLEATESLQTDEIPY